CPGGTIPFLARGFSTPGGRWEKNFPHPGGVVRNRIYDEPIYEISTQDRPSGAGRFPFVLRPGIEMPG
ncbi:MAG: hypothetical protein ACLFQB_14525, partial [Chitinispirillaceae bacterium]